MSEPTLEEKIASCSVDISLLATGWRPSEADLADAVPLWGWWPQVHSQLLMPALAGYSAHPSLGHGLMTTSPVLWLDPERTLARCLSRWYRLSDPQPETLTVPLTTWSQVKDLHRRVIAEIAVRTGQYPLKPEDG